MLGVISLDIKPSSDQIKCLKHPFNIMHTHTHEYTHVHLNTKYKRKRERDSMVLNT